MIDKLINKSIKIYIYIYIYIYAYDGTEYIALSYIHMYAYTDTYIYIHAYNRIYQSLPNISVTQDMPIKVISRDVPAAPAPMLGRFF